jgi:sodium/bile acid cotransporter 7
MPTALSAGITFTQAAGGNVAVALLLTVTSNMLGVFTMPFVLPAMLGGSLGGARLEPGPLLVRLIYSVLIPTIIGAAIRSSVPGENGALAG